MKKVWQALSDDNRRKILSLLKEKSMSAGEIAQQFNTTQPTISHHLNVLKEAGLINCEKHAQTLIYSINTTVFQEFLSSLANFFDLDGAKLKKTTQKEQKNESKF